MAPASSAGVQSGEELRKVDFKAGHAIFRERTPSEALYVIDSGSVQLSKMVHSEQCQLETLGVGDVLGESSLFDGSLYPVTAVALEPTRCLRVVGSQFSDMVSRSPDIALRIMKKLATRLIHSHFRLANFTLRDPTARLMHQLLAELDRADDRGAIPLPYDLPDVLCLERGAVDDMLRRLIREGMVSLGDQGTFSLVDEGSFRRYLSYLELKDRFDRLES